MSERGPIRADAQDVPEWLQGAWRRVFLRTADGKEDRSTEVLWLQTASLFADIRIPADRPPLGDRRGPDDCAPEELIAAAAARGFAGWTTYGEGVCRWHRPVDFQPSTGKEDAGRMELRDGALWEHGLAGDYVEEYRAATAEGHGAAAWMLETGEGQPRPGVLLLVDNLVMRAVGRSVGLPTGTSLACLVERHMGDPEILSQLFDCEISLAPTATLRVARSTLPWREADRLIPAGSLRVGEAEDVLVEERPSSPYRWRRRGVGPDAAAIASLLRG